MAMKKGCGKGLREENPYWIPTAETSKVRQRFRRQGEDEGENEGEDEDEKRRQKRKRTRRLRVENKVKHGGRLQDVASSNENMRKFAV